MNWFDGCLLYIKHIMHTCVCSELEGAITQTNANAQFNALTLPHVSQMVLCKYQKFYLQKDYRSNHYYVCDDSILTKYWQTPTSSSKLISIMVFQVFPPLRKWKDLYWEFPAKCINHVTRRVNQKWLIINEPTLEIPVAYANEVVDWVMWCL